MTVLVRSASLRGFRAVVAELGGDAERLLCAAGLPVAALDTDDLLIDDAALSLVLECAAEALHCPDFGLRLAARQDLGILGPLALAIQNSATFEDALALGATYLAVHTPTIELGAVADPYRVPGVLGLRFRLVAEVPLRRQAVDLTIGGLHRAIWDLAGGPYGLISVELPYPAPGSLAAHEAFFGAPVRFGARAGIEPLAMLRVPQSLRTQPIAGGNDTLRNLAIAVLDEQVPGRPSDLAPRVRTVVRRTLGTPAFGMETVAEVIHLHPRTMQRRLASESTTFAAIVDETRREQARRYLVDTPDLPLSRIAGLLGLSEQAALTRCCKRWWSTTPTQVRRGALDG